MLGKYTQELIDRCCPEGKKDTVSKIISTTCSSNLPNIGPGSEWHDLIDRIQLSVIRNSSWDINLIEKNIRLANLDWRDLLVQGGFADSLNAHITWQLQAIRSKDIS